MHKYIEDKFIAENQNNTVVVSRIGVFAFTACVLIPLII
jgi:hypothetical protein